MNTKIQDAIDTINAQCENNKAVIEALGSIETEFDLIQDKMRNLFRDVVKDAPADIHFTTIARACMIVGIGIDEQKDIEKEV
jgi:hypothetical protein